MGTKRILELGTLLALGGVLSVIGCESGSLPSSPTPETYAGQGPTGHAGEQPPMRLELEAVETEPGSSTLRLRAHVDSRVAYPTPAAISIEMPAGERHALLSAVDTHRIDVVAPGRISREFEIVRSPVQKPIKVVLDARDPEGAYGVHAEAWYPAAPQPAIVRPPRPPAVRPPGPPRFGPRTRLPADARKEVAQ